VSSKLPINVEDLLRQRTVEGERIEYKAGWNPEAVLHTVCAFANDFHNLGGGYIIIGVEEKEGQPVLPPKGVSPKSVDLIQREILELGHHALQPYYHPPIASYELNGKTLVVLWSPGGETSPYPNRRGLFSGGRGWGSF